MDDYNDYRRIAAAFRAKTAYFPLDREKLLQWLSENYCGESESVEDYIARAIIAVFDEKGAVVH